MQRRTVSVNLILGVNIRGVSYCVHKSYVTQRYITASANDGDFFTLSFIFDLLQLLLKILSFGDNFDLEVILSFR